MYHIESIQNVDWEHKISDKYIVNNGAILHSQKNIDLIQLFCHLGEAFIGLMETWNLSNDRS